MNDEFARGVIHQSDADMVVDEAGFELLGHFGKDFVGVQRGDGIAGNEIDEVEMASLGAFFLEEAGIFDGDTGFAGEYAKKFKMTFVVHAFRIGEDAERADGVIVSDEGHTAERAGGADRIDAELS